jgi:hypothetical protein
MTFLHVCIVVVTTELPERCGKRVHRDRQGHSKGIECGTAQLFGFKDSISIGPVQEKHAGLNSPDKD